MASAHKSGAKRSRSQSPHKAAGRAASKQGSVKARATKPASHSKAKPLPKPPQVAKAVKAIKSKTLSIKAQPEAPKGLKAVKAVKGVKAVKAVKPKPVAEVRPIGALPPEAVARAVRGSAPPPIARQTVRQPRETLSKQGAEGVSEKDFQEFEQRLQTERQKILKEMGYLENTVFKVNQRDSSGDLSGYAFHMADAGTDAMEREKAFLFASTEGRLLLEINEALRRIYRNEYGQCENCGQLIARARLEAMPYVRLCVSCKEKEEREARGAL